MWKPVNIVFYKTTLKLLYYINYCIKHWQKIITSISGRFWGSWSGMLWRRSAPRPPGCQSWGGCCLGIWGSTPNAVSAGLNSRKWTSGTECGTRTGSTTGGAEGAGPPGGGRERSVISEKNSDLQGKLETLLWVYLSHEVTVRPSRSVLPRRDESL